jgi:hypothetical protein
VAKTREPWIVEHDQVVGAGSRFEIYQFFLKKICVRKLSDFDLRARLLFVIACGLFQGLAFNARDNGKSQSFSSRLICAAES